MRPIAALGLALIVTTSLAGEAAPPPRPGEPSPTAPGEPIAPPSEDAASAQEPPAPPSAASGQVNGTVLDARRRPAVGVAVAAIARDGALLHGTSTDETGRYAFRGLGSGLYDVILEPAGAPRIRKEGIRVRPLFRSIVDFSLPDAPLPGTSPSISVAAEPGGTSIRVEAAIASIDRAPAPDALVSLTPASAAAGTARGERTGAEGTCVLQEVPPGQYRFAVRSPGQIPWSVGPIDVTGAGRLRLVVHLVPFPMGFAGTLEDLLIPADPIQP